MSRFSQAYRAMPADGSLAATLERGGESVLHRAEPAKDAGRAKQWQQPYAEVIEVEFETVLPPEPEPHSPQAEFPRARRDERPASDPVFESAQPAAAPDQPPPPDIEAIAAALAAEMDRKAAGAPQQNEPMTDTTATAAVLAPASISAAPDPAPIPEAPATFAPAIAAAPAPGAERPANDDAPAFAAPEGKAAAQIPVFARRAASQAMHYGRAYGSLAAEFARTKAVPAMAGAGLWLARNLRRKELRRRYGTALAFVHGRVLDRKLEQHFYLPTLELQRFAPDADRGILYEGPVPTAAFDWVMSELPADLREYAFVDFRAGRGRAMLLAAHRNFERIIGFEYDASLHDDLLMNVAQFPRSRMRCRDVQCFRGDRLGVSIPDQPCVLYFSNAWREELLAGIMNYVREAYRHKPRRIYIILENIDDKVALPPDEIFNRMEIPLAKKLKLRLLSPMDFQIYRSLL